MKFKKVLKESDLASTILDNLTGVGIDSSKEIQKVASNIKTNASQEQNPIKKKALMKAASDTSNLGRAQIEIKKATDKVNKIKSTLGPNNVGIG